MLSGGVDGWRDYPIPFLANLWFGECKFNIDFNGNWVKTKVVTFNGECRSIMTSFSLRIFCTLQAEASCYC